MSYYLPLRDHLAGQRRNKFIMTFSEIESHLGFALPTDALLPQWWNNQRDGERPQGDAWGDAGYQAFLIFGSNSVRFLRAPR
jgi:hypothetical protein